MSTPASTTQLRILHLCHPAPFGGLESVVEMLSSGLLTRGHLVTVATVLPNGGEHPFEARIQAHSIPVRRLSVPGRRYDVERKALRRLLLAEKPHVLHTHGYRADVLAPGVARRAGIPVVSTVHGFTGGGWRNAIYEYLQLRSYRKMQGVVAVSEPIRERLAASGVPGDRVHLIRNSVAPRAAAMSRAEARAQLQLPESAFAIGWVGRLSREKGPDILIQMAPALVAAGCTVALIGDGPMRPSLLQSAEALVQPGGVRFLGEVPEAARYLSAFDMLAMTSRTEGTPIVMLEAFQSGVPVVSTAVGGVPAVAGEGEALLVPAEDAAALTEAVLRAKGDAELRANMVQRARARLAAEFGFAPWVQRYEALYRDVLSRWGGA